MLDLDCVGDDWLVEMIEGLTEELTHVGPVEFNEQNRYLPDSVTSRPGFISYDLFPFLREILEAADPRSSVRECNLMKGVQVGYTTLLESILFYYIGCVKTRPSMLVSADKELAQTRIEANILPMLNYSGLGDLIQSADEGNHRKTGKTSKLLQWQGGGYLLPVGANNADKLRSASILLMLKDELDAWKDTVGRDGDPDALTDDRCSAFWEIRKIYRGSTALIKGTSKIHRQFLRGDQREYRVLCRKCNYPQALKWRTVDAETGQITGFVWETEDGVLIPESVAYLCVSCGHAHYEYDKPKLFATNEGAHWHPTARPVVPGIRSYHLPAFYSPVGFQPWYKCVTAFLDGFCEETQKVKDIKAYQVFVNNIKGEPFEIMGQRIRFSYVSAHRRAEYLYGQVPNQFAREYAAGAAVKLVHTVDVHKESVFSAIWAVCPGARLFLVDYDQIESLEKNRHTEEPDEYCFQALRERIDERVYTADDGRQYRVAFTLIDAGYAQDTVLNFCAQWESNVVPIIGRERASKNARIVEFEPWRTKLGTTGYKVVVDHYKDRLATVLRREWTTDLGIQSVHHFNAPINATDKQLKQLTTESKREKILPNGQKVSYWFRPSAVPNELFDLLGYAHAAVEIMAYNICREHFELETVDMPSYWEYLEREQIFYTAPEESK